MYQLSDLHINLSHIELHLPDRDVQPVIKAYVVVLALSVLLFKKKTEASFTLCAPAACLNTSIYSLLLLIIQASAAPGWGGHACHTVDRVGHGVQIG